VFDVVEDVLISLGRECLLLLYLLLGVLDIICRVD
jgi:hypothetical protein